VSPCRAPPRRRSASVSLQSPQGRGHGRGVSVLSHRVLTLSCKVEECKPWCERTAEEAEEAQDLVDDLPAHLVVAAQVGIDSKVCKRFNIFLFQALKPGAVNLGSSWGQGAAPYLVGHVAVDPQFVVEQHRLRRRARTLVPFFR